MTEWNPELYLTFAGPRLRPALDLLARIEKDDVELAYDLGCGPGNLTEHLARRWPRGEIVGVDSSRKMLERARAKHPERTWIHADIAEWTPERPAGLLYSNACFHWLPDHASLLPRLARSLEPGGVFAIQMPDNFGSPSHQLLEQAARESRWSEKLLAVMLRNPVAAPEVYYDLLAPLSRSIDIWQTTYLHVLEGDDPVARWLRGAALRPVLDALEDAEDREAFFSDYSRRVARAYPRREDGKTLFPFRRLFVVAEVA